MLHPSLGKDGPAAAPERLPYKGVLDIGAEKVELRVSAIRDGVGEHLGAMVTWDIVTKKVKAKPSWPGALHARELAEQHPVVRSGSHHRLSQPAARATLDALAGRIPLSADALNGRSLAALYPTAKRWPIADRPANLPHCSTMRLGARISTSW